ncbi:hypothetical protein DTO10_18210 [Peribacillus butanolivorans]|uniref:Uncharacterized protein n=1 Tax=Peribacillus butanolivorans TaxID=421767 RepID=A0ABM6XNT8_9BACI|nr:hypothetical protein DTO10_18210 [Peribacillus butanolivorans]
MLILPPLEINAGFSVRIDDPSSFIGKIKKKQKTSPIMGEVSECRQTPFPKELLEKKGVFYLLISIFSCKFERRTQYIVAKLFIKNSCRLCRQPETSPIMGEVFLTNKQAICAINQ